MGSSKARVRLDICSLTNITVPVSTPLDSRRRGPTVSTHPRTIGTPTWAGSILSPGNVPNRDPDPVSTDPSPSRSDRLDRLCQPSIVRRRGLLICAPCKENDHFLYGDRIVKRPDSQPVPCSASTGPSQKRSFVNTSAGDCRNGQGRRQVVSQNWCSESASQPTG